MNRKPNILLIITDQQNASMMGCAGNRYCSTPAMDSIAAEGVRFERAFCTNAACVPSRFSLMTGLMPSRIGMISNRTADIGEVPGSIQQRGLGFRLREAGYETAYGGKEHLPNMRAVDVGFDYICADERDMLAGACVEFVKQRRDRPFCLVASFINPHDICYMALRDFAESESDRRLVEAGRLECTALDAALKRPAGDDDESFFSTRCPPLPPNFEPSPDEPEAADLLAGARSFRSRARREWSERRWREHRWAYARLTERVDGQIGRLLEGLRESGEWENTVVVFTSDHGDLDGAHRLEHKSALYDEAVRIPFIIKPAGMKRTGRVDTQNVVSNGLDLLPTLCDWAGANVDTAGGGESLRPVVENEGERVSRTSVPVECAVGRAIIDRRYAFARYDIGERGEQLYDHRDDPFEQRNALNDETHRHALARLQSSFEACFGPGGRDPKRIMTAAADS